MINIVLSWLGSLLGGPFAKSALEAYKAKLDSSNNQDSRTVDLAKRELDLEQREAELNSQRAVLGSWYSPERLFGYIMVSFIGKVVIYDNMLGSLTHGNTDPLGGDVGVWAGWIMMFWLGKRTIENTVAILKR